MRPASSSLSARPVSSQLRMCVLAVLAFSALVPACSSSGGSSGGAAPAAAVTGSLGSGGTAATTPPGSSLPPAAPVPRWWKGDFHVHTLHSGDAFDSVAQTRDMARYMGLDFVVLTDHDTLDQTRDPEFFSTPEVALLPGCEWTDIAHAGAIGIRSLPPLIDRSRDPATWVTQAQARIDATHSEGGAWILYHPTWNHHMWMLAVRDFDAVEVWNSFWTVMDIGFNPTGPAELQQRLDQFGFSAAGVAPSPEIVAAANSQGGGNDRALFFWEEFLERGERVAAVGGSDRHDHLPPGYPTTWVLSPSRDQADLVAALRAGRTMVTEGPDGPRVDFTADGDGDGSFEVMLGDEVPAAGAMVPFRVRIAGARTGLMRVIRRRTVIYERQISADDELFQFADIPRSGDWYRVDVFLPVDWSLPSVNLVLSPFAGANGGLSPVLSLWGVSLMLGTNKPLFDLEERYRRILNVNQFDMSWSRAAITSPIYAR